VKNFNLKDFDVEKFDSILARGLSCGMGTQGSQVCIEAAICETLGMKHSDNPKCVASSVRSFKIALNDKKWSSPQARAEGLRDLGIAQLGSLGVVDNNEFRKKLAELFIRELIPTLFREVFPNKPEALKAADECEKLGTRESAIAAKDVAYKIRNADAAAYAAFAADAADAASYAADAADAAAYAAFAADAAFAASKSKESRRDFYLGLAAKLALKVLISLKSPGCELLKK
jgi:hypothetical protein